MDKRTTATLTMTITNPAANGAGTDLEYRFGTAGGSIGTAVSDTWRLSPHRTGIVAGHVEVRYLDGEFCLIDRSGRTYVNSASQPVGRGRRVRLKHGDTVSIGRYQLRAGLTSAEASQTAAEPEPEDDQLVNGMAASLVKASTGVMALEPLAEFAPEAAETLGDDPMTHWYAEPKPGQDTPERTEMMDETAGAKHPREPGQSRNHIGGAPLMRGMETELSFADSDHMRLFLEEAGQTLRATVQGLLALHQGEDSRHQALRTRLQPIEDNPLRLGDGYHDTVQTLFASQRSPVHLSAPAAVRESLESLHHHQLATREAIRQALEAILHAFSPEALLRRFHGYRRGLQPCEDEGQWAWDMYQHYYRELKSSRQQGFERLFQEVFDQAYDQHLRQLQRESLS